MTHDGNKDDLVPGREFQNRAGTSPVGASKRFEDYIPLMTIELNVDSIIPGLEGICFNRTGRELEGKYRYPYSRWRDATRLLNKCCSLKRMLIPEGTSR